MKDEIKSTILFLVVAFLLIMGITFLLDDSSRDSLTGDSSTDDSSLPAQNNTNYSLVEVQKHSTQSNCWTIVRTNVYDLTAWIDEHPGGSEAILTMCGKDATAAFEAQHGGQSRPEEELTRFQIGIYKN